jgi:hypothetical protein
MALAPQTDCYKILFRKRECSNLPPQLWELPRRKPVFFLCSDERAALATHRAENLTPADPDGLAAVRRVNATPSF